jgi:hypothetical protein
MLIRIRVLSLELLLRFFVALLRLGARRRVARRAVGG